MKRCYLLVLLSLLVGTARADSGAPVGKATYESASGEFSLEVDPRWNDDHSEIEPLLTFRREGDLLWRRSPEDFESFRFPIHAVVANDGEHLVFGGVSVHNFGNYDEGLRIYNSAGELVRFVSRRDLPAGQYSVSTAHWFDASRTTIRGQTLFFYTPGKSSPIEFNLRTGEVSPADAVVLGQGDDKENWRKRWAVEFVR